MWLKESMKKFCEMPLTTEELVQALIKHEELSSSLPTKKDVLSAHASNMGEYEPVYDEQGIQVLTPEQQAANLKRYDI